MEMLGKTTWGGAIAALTALFISALFFGAAADNIAVYAFADPTYVDEAIEDISPITVADDDKFTITVTGKGADYTGDPCYRMLITNRTGKDVAAYTEEAFKVGDKDAEAFLGVEVDAGVTIETEMYFDREELGGGSEQLTAVEGTVYVSDFDSNDVLDKYVFRDQEAANYQSNTPSSTSNQADTSNDSSKQSSDTGVLRTAALLFVAFAAIAVVALAIHRRNDDA